MVFATVMSSLPNLLHNSTNSFFGDPLPVQADFLAGFGATFCAQLLSEVLGSGGGVDINHGDVSDRLPVDRREGLPLLRRGLGWRWWLLLDLHIGIAVAACQGNQICESKILS